MANEIIPSNYDDIKQTVIDKLVEKGYSADVLGSNANLLADILTYLSYSVNVNTAFQASEMLLNRAMFRKNILYGAKLLGYEAARKISYRYKLTIIPQINKDYDKNSVNVRTYSIPKYLEFTSNGNTFYYMGESLTQDLSNKDITDGNFEPFTIVVKEGNLLKYNDNKNTQLFTLGSTINSNGEIVADKLIKIPNIDIENDGLELFLTYVDNITGEQKIDEYWEKSEQFMIDADTDTNKKYFVLNNIETQGVDVYFEISNIGTKLLAGTQIKVNILESKGADGAGDINNFSFAEKNDLLKIENRIVYKRYKYRI